MAMGEICSSIRPPAACTTGRRSWRGRTRHGGRGSRGGSTCSARSASSPRWTTRLPSSSRTSSVIGRQWPYQAHRRMASSSSSCWCSIAHGLLNTFGDQAREDPRRHQCVVARCRRGGHLPRVCSSPRQQAWHRRCFDSCAVPGLTGLDGRRIHHDLSVRVSGCLLAQYTITGFDASAHVSEETIGARTEAPKAIVRSIYISAIAAFVLEPVA